jgi:hypothetical protein
MMMKNTTIDTAYRRTHRFGLVAQLQGFILRLLVERYLVHLILG